MKKRLKAAKTILLILSLFSIIFLGGCADEFPEEPARQVKFAADPEFVTNEDGLPALQAKYDFHFDKVYEIAIGLTHEALRAGDVEAAKGNATDAMLRHLQLVSLKDDKQFFPVSNPAPVINAKILEQYPEIEYIMAAVTASLNNETMINLNYMVDMEEYTPHEAAYLWLQREGLISDVPREPLKRGQEEAVIIGSHNFVEMTILGHITLIALEYGGIPVIDSTETGDTLSNRLALEEGEIHMCWEYTNTAWSTIYEETEVLMDAETVYEGVARKDAEIGLIWLDYAPVNNTCTIMMRQEHAAELGISTISELAAWVKEVQSENASAALF